MDQIQLDKAAPLPIAEQLAGELLRRIVNGNLQAGEKLPTERDLAEQLGIARGTVKRAYARLSTLGAIAVRQGSGSYVLENGVLLEENQKKETAELLSATINRLRDIGLSDREISNLVRLQIQPQEPGRKIGVLVLSNNHGILSELEAQLSYLIGGAGVNYALSFTTLTGISAGRNPVEALLGYDLIVATSVDYPATLELYPMYRHKVIEATLVPRTRTLMQLGDLPRDQPLSVVYRTPQFLNLVCTTLASLGFDRKKIHAYQESVYTPSHHNAHGEAAIIGFNEAPMYVDHGYRLQNERFIEAGGQLIRFEYRIDRTSLSLVEDRISALL